MGLDVLREATGALRDPGMAWLSCEDKQQKPKQVCFEDAPIPPTGPLSLPFQM